MLYENSKKVHENRPYCTKMFRMVKYNSIVAR